MKASEWRCPDHNCTGYKDGIRRIFRPDTYGDAFVHGDYVLDSVFTLYSSETERKAKLSEWLWNIHGGMVDVVFE